MKRSPAGAPLAFLVNVPDTDECVEWPFARNDQGYGRIRHQGSTRNANTLALHLVQPRPSTGLMSLHSCDNPPCVNPRHLRWGTHQENSAEAVERQRTVRGEKQPGAKLTAALVTELRHAVACGKTPASLSNRYDLRAATIADAVSGRTWSWLDTPTHVKPARGLTADQVREIRRLNASGMKQRDVAAAFGTSQASVSAIVLFKIYKDVDVDPADRMLTGAA